MASGQEWYTDKITSLLQEDLRVSTLNELKDHLGSLPHEEASRISNVLQLALIFDCLNDNNIEQVNLACDVLSLCLGNLNLGESTNRYGSALERALNHPFSAVKLMALKEIKRSLLNEDGIYALCTKTSLIMNIVSCFKDDDLVVSREALHLIYTIGITIPGIKKITSAEILASLEDAMKKDELVRMRVYEMIISISVQNSLSFETFLELKLIERILFELENNDVLIKMNIVEILSQLGQSDHGYAFLDRRGILHKLISLLSEDDYNMELCHPAILRFFGTIGHKKPLELLRKYTIIFDKLFLNISGDDMTMLEVSLDAIGHIAETSEGKIALQSTGNKTEAMIKTISSRLGSLRTEVKVTVLNCFENLLRVTDNKDEAVCISQEWYSFIDANPMDVILKYAKNPFPELRLAGLGILNAICGYMWGQEAVKNTAGLIEFLLDRSVESRKECKESKYEIVKLLSSSTIYDNDTLKRLQNFVKEGPFYVQASTEIAIEGN